MVASTCETGNVFVKVCGITSEEDALLAVAMGADAIGFVFASSSRQMQPPQVADIVKRLPPEVITVGVFRDQAPDRVVDLMQRCNLKVAQLHGHETANEARTVRDQVRATIVAFPANSLRLAQLSSYGADLVLLDADEPGSGAVFDWALADAIPPGHRVLLAGGLTPDNVADAIHRVEPFGVDVSSGVESAPGTKDPVKLQAFISAAKSAGRDLRVSAPAASGDRPYDWMQDR